jgi:hypothetical protein
MSWQILIWNIFVWSFTGLMIYITNSSLLWLLLPAMFTATDNVVKIMQNMEEKKEPEEDSIDEETKAKMIALRERARRGSL